MRVYKVYKLYAGPNTYGGNFGDKYFFNVKNAYEFVATMLSLNIVCEVDIIETEDELDG